MSEKSQAFAQKITDRTYPFQLSDDELREAKANKLLVVYGVSDDLTEFEGIINDEMSAYDYQKFYVTRELKVIDDADLEDIENLKEEGWTPPKGKEVLVTVAVEFSPDEPECTWLISTDTPHTVFDIVEDGELYCRGLVIDMTELLNA
jgi:hypothetical protein